MKKFKYVMWLVLAIGSGFIIAALNSELFVLPFLLGGMGLAAVVVLLAVFITALYKVWVGRVIWTNQDAHEKNI